MREERTEREVERFQERERNKGERESGEGKGTRGGGKHCLNEGTETPRGQESRLTKLADAETRGSGGRLSRTGKRHSVVLEVPISSPEKGTIVPSWCHHKVCYQSVFLTSLTNRN